MTKLVAPIAQMLVDGVYTINDDELFKLLALLKNTENIKAEPSACASLFRPLAIEKESIHIC